MSYWLRFNQLFDHYLQWPQHLFLLMMRVWLAWIFFKSGLLKIQSWDSTLELFAYEYQVPLLPPDIAAYLGTAAELLLPPLLALGLLTRPVALALFVFNIVALYAYPDISAAGIKDHYLWGLGFMWLFLQGAGRVSVDEILTLWAKKSHAK